MTWQDLVNGMFELVVGVFSWINVVVLWRDRQVRGVSQAAWAVFGLWGLWNLYYYPHLGQWASFAGGCVIVSANFAWLVLAMRFK